MGSDLIRRAISGNPEALSSLIDKYRDIAFNLALSIVRNNEDAKDITQESFLKVLENINRYRNESKFTTWLYRIVYNQSIQYVKDRNQRKHIEAEVLIRKESPDPEIPDEEQFYGLYRAINRLEEPEQTIILLFYLGEKSVKEIRTVTALSTSNIKVILHRARKKLFKELNYEKV